MKYFRIEELVRCYREEGSRCQGCPLKQRAQTLPNDADANIRAMVEQVLDPVREKLGTPIKVNSGYRCRMHNAAVGGVVNSQHQFGLAADIAPMKDTGTTVTDLARGIVENGVFDQMVIYPTFVHVSYKRKGVNRRQILRKTATGYQKTGIDEVNRKEERT